MCKNIHNVCKNNKSQNIQQSQRHEHVYEYFSMSILSGAEWRDGFEAMMYEIDSFMDRKGKRKQKITK